jgi:hypothetical protein
MNINYNLLISPFFISNLLIQSFTKHVLLDMFKNALFCLSFPFANEKVGVKQFVLILLKKLILYLFVSIGQCNMNEIGVNWISDQFVE